MIRKKSGKIEISLEADFVYDGSSKNRALSEARLKSGLACVEKFYQHVGLQLHLNYKISSNWIDEWKSDNTIHFSDRGSRSDSAHWNVLTEGSTAFTPDQSCGSMAHEIGHALGLHDEYADDSCPGRLPGPLDDIMHSGTDGASNTTLHPEDLSLILKPFCKTNP